ncbi:hypothetical protein B5M43_003020 [Microbacterium sp. MEC084]|uniref:hypothetical protein n=1 Tax=Microbacterium sp. MEC084 TaxID=1963027 RepID=UPI00106F9DAC|nr:hypothetical protein [Microbacterium sp. MEC084]MCD1267819.1 hypothetical protein [Microbacterium sp. MEC084]
MADRLPNPVWGLVPEPVSGVLQRLKERAATAAEEMDTSGIAGTTPRNHNEAFINLSRAAETADQATRDYRSVFNAYVHRFHQPKPPIGRIAAAQGVITQVFAKRYTSKTVAAVKALISPWPDLDALRAGISSLGFEDLRGLSPELDAAMDEAAANPDFEPWLPSVEKARE